MDAQIIKTAFKSLWDHKLRSALMMAGIVLGVAIFVVVNSVGGQFKDGVAERVRKFGIENIVVFPFMGKLRMPPGSDNSVTSLTFADVEAIKTEVPGVRYADPAMIRPGVNYKYGARETTATLYGATPLWEVVRDFGTETGEFISEEDVSGALRVCVLGRTVAGELFGDEDPLGKTIRINNTGFRVKGVLVSRGAAPGRMGDMDNRVVIPITTFGKKTFRQDHLNMITLRVEDVKRMDAVDEAVTGLLRERHNITDPSADDFTTRRPVNIIKILTRTSTKVTLFLTVLSFLFLVMGGSVVMSIMLASVRERRSEIGLRKAVGARSSDILLQFCLESVIITVPAGAAGFILGIAGTWTASSIIQLPPTVSLKAAALALSMSVLTGVVFGILPATRAAGIDPAGALRV